MKLWFLVSLASGSIQGTLQKSKKKQKGIFGQFARPVRPQNKIWQMIARRITLKNGSCHDIKWKHTRKSKYALTINPFILVALQKEFKKEGLT